MRELGGRRDVPQVKGMPLMWHGVGSLITAVPAAVLLTMVWNIILGFLPITPPEGDFLSGGYAILAMLPMFTAPLWCVWGLVRCFKYKEAPGVMACGVMSAIGLMFACMACLVFHMVITGKMMA